MYWEGGLIASAEGAIVRGHAPLEDFKIWVSENALPSKAKELRELSEVKPSGALSFSSLWAGVTNPAHSNNHPNYL